MTLRIYESSEMTGVWPVTGYQSYHRSYYAIYEMLKAALVEGRPGHPPAGWIMLADEIATGTGLRYAITNAARSGVLVVDTIASVTYRAARFHVCETFLDFDNMINVWSYEHNPELDPSGSKKGHSLYSYDFASSSSSKFTVIANENAAVIHATPHINYQTGATDSNGEMNTTMYIGAAIYGGPLGTITAPALGNFVVCGGSRNQYSYVNDGYRFFFSESGSDCPVSVLRNPDATPRTASIKYGYIGLRYLRSNAEARSLVLLRMDCGLSNSSGSFLAHFSIPVFLSVTTNIFSADKVVLEEMGGGFYMPTAIDGQVFYPVTTGYRYGGVHYISLNEEDWQ